MPQECLISGCQRKFSMENCKLYFDVMIQIHFPYKQKAGDQILHSRLPKVLIYINFIDLESLTIHAKFKDHHTSGPEEEFQMLLPHYTIIDFNFYYTHFYILFNKVDIRIYLPEKVI